MNIFEQIFRKIKTLIKKNKKKKDLKINNFKGINLKIHQINFDFDLSTNIALVLAKKII